MRFGSLRKRQRFMIESQLRTSMACSRIPLVLFSLVLALLLRDSSSRLGTRVVDLDVVGGNGTKGYIQATIMNRYGSRETGPVCGSVNSITASFACLSKGLHSSLVQGTVDSIGGISQPTSVPVLSNLDCTSYSNENGFTTYGCSFSTAATCAPGDSAAVECNLTAGELAAIIVVCAIVFFGSVCGFTFGCLFYWYRRECRPQRRYQVRVNAELSRRQSSDLPTSSQQSCQKPVLSDLDPPTYQQELDKEASSSAPPAYED